MEGGRVFPELILAAESIDSQHYVVEGHTRITAYCRSGMADEYEAIVAYSPDLAGWAFL